MKQIPPPFSEIERNSIRKKLYTEGYALIKNAFKISDIEKLDLHITEHFKKSGIIHRYGKAQPNIINENREFEWVLTQPKILDIMRSIFDDKIFYFTGHADIHRNINFGWHKDDGRGRYFNGDYMSDENCQVYKIGIYTGDHSKDKGGLTVKPGSHLVERSESMEEISIPSEPGDVVIFDVRITHKGKQRDWLERKFLSIGKFLGDRDNTCKFGEVIFNLYNQIIGKSSKKAMFFTVGANNSQTIKFSIENMKRQIQQTGRNISTPHADFLKRIELAGMLYPNFKQLL
ncbi:phytanoyl-CoA dioxygenase family protein [Bowmanella pacifica]|uniref:Phytanoyl-CoA dioxygenase n=1 Tax=Bowmanella pacifica TaxID=502051 RepID=A0A917Z429_9ALTE|nr:phytanoyl-CoA dioxygenase family protein [Bowmanella pacifica]GGO73857.1 hypothetical protein GCM10010982_35360 [Bowmanella pacifica]